MGRDFLTADLVARELGLPNGPAFLRRRATLESNTGFPPPMPHSSRPLLWKADEVRGWAARHGNAPGPEDMALPPGVLADALASGKVALMRMARTA